MIGCGDVVMWSLAAATVSNRRPCPPRVLSTGLGYGIVRGSTQVIANHQANANLYGCTLFDLLPNCLIFFQMSPMVSDGLQLSPMLSNAFQFQFIPILCYYQVRLWRRTSACLPNEDSKQCGRKTIAVHLSININIFAFRLRCAGTRGRPIHTC